MASEQENWVENRTAFAFGAVLALLWALIFMLRNEVLLSDPDISWHIKTGEWIWGSRSVPTTDPFSHTFAGQPWIAKEWLSQLLLFGAHHGAGWNGVVLLAMAAVVLGAGALYFVLSKDLSPIFAVVACLSSLALAGANFTARPHLLTLAVLIVWTYQMFRASREMRAPSFGWLLLLVLWANLHAAFTIGFVVAGFAFLDFLERARLSRPDMIWKWVMFLALCPLVTLTNPYGWHALLPTLTAIVSNEAIPMIDEWQPFNAQEHIVQASGLMILLFATLVSGFRLGLAKALFICFLLYLSLAQSRYQFFFFPVLAIVTAPELARQFPRLSAAYWRAQPRDGLETAIGRYFRVVVAGLLAGSAVVVALQLRFLRAAPPESVAASAAMAFVRADGIEGHVFNGYNFGGPLILNGIPTFIDGRTDQLFLGGFAKRFTFGPDNGAELAQALRDHDISWTLLPPKDPRNALLGALPGWRQVFSDEFAVIYQRQKDPAP